MTVLLSTIRDFAHCTLIVSGGEGATNLTLAGQTVVTGVRALGERTPSTKSNEKETRKFMGGADLDDDEGDEEDENQNLQHQHAKAHSH
ncbi:unnamed protein product [Sphagnum troendelagicum]